MGTIKITINQFYALADDIIIKPHKTDEELEIIKIDAGFNNSIRITLKSGEEYIISKEGETLRAN